MPRGEKSGNPRMKHHRAARIAEQIRRQGAPRGEAYRIATAAMAKEYDRVGPRDRKKMAVNEGAHDSRTGQRKTNLTTQHPAVSGARKPSVAQHASSSRRTARRTGGGGKASAGRKPRTSSHPAMHPRADLRLGSGHATTPGSPGDCAPDGSPMGPADRSARRCRRISPGKRTGPRA